MQRLRMLSRLLRGLGLPRLRMLARLLLLLRRMGLPTMAFSASRMLAAGAAAMLTRSLSIFGCSRALA